MGWVSIVGLVLSIIAVIFIPLLVFGTRAFLRAELLTMEKHIIEQHKQTFVSKEVFDVTMKRLEGSIQHLHEKVDIQKSFALLVKTLGERSEEGEE